MAKKSFTGGLSSLIKNTKEEAPPKEKKVKEAPEVKRGRPITNTKEVEKESQRGTKEGETRATFIVKEDTLEKIFAIAYWEREQKKDVIDQALTEFINKYEKKHGSVKNIPKK